MTSIVHCLEFRKPHNVRVIRAAKPVCRRTTERCKVLNPEYNIFRDQPTPGASPLRINTLLSRDLSSSQSTLGFCRIGGEKNT